MAIARRCSISLCLAVAASAPALAQTFTTNAASSGTPFSPGVRGQAVPALAVNRTEYTVAVPKALEVAKGSSIRGVAGGSRRISTTGKPAI